MKKKYILLLHSMLFFILGCMDFTSEIYVTKNGSGTITNTILYTPEILSIIEQMPDNTQQNGKKTSFLEQAFQKEKLQQEAKKYGQGVTLVSSKYMEQANGYKGYCVTYAFQDINTIHVREMIQDENKANTEQNRYFFHFQKGNPATLTITTPPGKKQQINSNEKIGKPSPNTTRSMQKILKGFRMKINLKVEGEISKTNATLLHEDNTGITLLDMDIDKMLQDKKLMEKISELGELQDIPTAKEKLKGTPYIQYETRPKVMVTY